jgi:hypothetical protein
MNHELNELIENADIVRFIKSRIIAWLGHVMWMDEKRTPIRANFRFLPCIIIVNHFYYLTNALNYTK